MEYTLIIRVIGEEDEPSISINQVSDTDLEVLEPLLLDIQGHQGYYPKGDFERIDQPTARDLYRKHEAWQMFETLVPKPPSGFELVYSVEVFSQQPLKMNMT